MLYSIIPPILIVVSLVGIIIFLVKKAPEVANLEDDYIGKEEVSEKKSFWARFTKSETQEDKKDFKHRVLLSLEKMTKRLKVMFLKLENMISAWGDSFRSKRQAREEEKNIHLAEIIEAENISEKEKEKDKENDLEGSLKKREVKSRTKKEKRDIFESILVERIAANPKDVEAYERLGEYYLEIENNNYAKECFKQVLKLNPKNENVRIKMRKLERILGK